MTNSDSLAEVLIDNGCASMMSWNETIEYPALLLPSTMKLLSAVNQIESGFSRGWSVVSPGAVRGEESFLTRMEKSILIGRGQ